MTDARMTPQQAAAQWFTSRLGRLVPETDIESVNLGVGLCAEPLRSDGLCMQRPGHGGAHHAYLHVDEQGRMWRLTPDV
jgi:hypothetical protein